jgi:NADPH:quinone reductase-like Zn-dependent oxidoreductase
MKAIACTKYGPPEVLQIKEVEKPKPKDNEVLVKVYATVVTSGDCRMRSLNLVGVPFFQRILARLILGITKPRNPIPGLWLAGEIETAGKAVKKFKKGDRVYARTPDLKFGAYAEYACLSENGFIALIPSNLNYAEAVAFPFGGVTALYFLKKAKIQRGKKVLVYGASGATGTAAVQLAKYFRAEVTGVCSTANLELVKSLGADKVIDYTKEDYANGNELFDIIFDAVGKISYTKSKKVLSPHAEYVSVISSGHSKVGIEELILLNTIIEEGKLIPVIDRVYTLEQMVEAHRYVDKGHKKGNVVITLEEHS